jgi:hypothetical protein
MTYFSYGCFGLVSIAPVSIYSTPASVTVHRNNTSMFAISFCSNTVKGQHINERLEGTSFQDYVQSLRLVRRLPATPRVRVLQRTGPLHRPAPPAQRPAPPKGLVARWVEWRMTFPGDLSR